MLYRAFQSDRLVTCLNCGAIIWSARGMLRVIISYGLLMISQYFMSSNAFNVLRHTVDFNIYYDIYHREQDDVFRDKMTKLYFHCM